MSNKIAPKKSLLILIGSLAVAALITVATLPLNAERLLGVNVVHPHERYPVSEAAQNLHATLQVADWHTDSLMWLRDILEASDIGQVDVPRLEQANMAVQIFTSVTRVPDNGINLTNNPAEGDKIAQLAFADKWPDDARRSLFQRSVFHANKLQDLAERAPQRIRVISSKQDLQQLLSDRNQGDKVIGAVLGTEGLHSLEGELDNLYKLYDHGYRVMGLFHFFDNELGGSLHGVSHKGLSEFGVEVVKAMNQLGMIIDVAHASYESVKDILTLAERPVILSHTGMRGACDSHRNIPDELMKKIAAKGGVIGIGFWETAICNTSPERIVEHLRYAVDLLGVEHVSLGSDYDGSVDMPFDVSEISVLTSVMLEQGFSESEIRAIMGENILRILSEQLPAS